MFLSQPYIDEDPDQHPVLFRMRGVAGKSAAQDRPKSSGIAWEKLPNGRMPTQQWSTALFGAGDSLVMVGGKCAGKHSSLDTVQEYCLSTGHWLEPTDWPKLPERRQAQHPVTMGNAVHLFGGGIKENVNKMFAGRSGVVTMEMENGRHGRAWKTDAFQPSPQTASGAGKLFNTVAVAGGWKSGLRQSEVYVWDARTRQWLRLPNLNIARDQTSLVFFKGYLLAFGGGDKPGHWVHSVEHFSTSSLLGLTEEI